jgi:hypothetical protein
MSERVNGSESTGGLEIYLAVMCERQNDVAGERTTV